MAESYGVAFTATSTSARLFPGEFTSDDTFADSSHSSGCFDSKITGIQPWVFDMNSFAAVVMMENVRYSSNDPVRHAVQTPAKDMMEESFRKILNGPYTALVRFR